MAIQYHPIIQTLKTEFSYHADVLRLDLIDEEVSGNKWFKLKHNIEKALDEGKDTLLTFGGTVSNHIAATAAAAKKYNLKSIGIIRGEAPLVLNSTLLKAQENGMYLHFISREFYSKKNEDEVRNELKNQFGDYYLIPEGGNNIEGVLGSTEILKPDWKYDYVLCACGTATTYAGMVLSEGLNQKIVGISVLKGTNLLPAQTQKTLEDHFPESVLKISGNEELEKNAIEENCITNTYAFKGFANYDKELVDFKTNFEQRYGMPLDYVYTNKLMYAAFDLMKKNKLKEHTRILLVHSGGLQGNKSFEERYHLTPTL